MRPRSCAGEVAKASESAFPTSAGSWSTRAACSTRCGRRRERRNAIARARPSQEARELAERLERELAGTPQAQERLSAQLEETRATVAELRATREKVDALEAELAKQRGAGDDRRRLESELRDTRTRLEQLEAALAEARDRAGDEAALATALTALREHVAALAGDLAQVRDTASGEELAELRSRLGALESAGPEAPPELRELLERTSARVGELERAHAGDGDTEGIGAALDELRARVDALAGGLESHAAERDERLRAAGDDEERLAAELAETRAAVGAAGAPARGPRGTACEARVDQRRAHRGTPNARRRPRRHTRQVERRSSAP